MTCTQCNGTIIYTTEDQELYERLKAPDPTLCAACSERLKFSFRNERHFHRTTSCISGKPIISIYAPDTPYKACHREEWFSDPKTDTDELRP